MVSLGLEEDSDEFMQEQASFIAGALTALNEPVPDAGFSICIMSGRNLLKQYKELFEDEKKR